jgi:opacity protein-like surface antigen
MLMKSFFAVAMIALLGVWMVPAAALADPVDNPQYAAWNKCGVGTTVTYAQTAGTGAQQIQIEVKKTISEKTDDHITLDVTKTATINGQAAPPQNNKETVQAKLDKKPDLKPLPDEEIDVVGKKTTCKVYEMDIKDMQGGDVKVKMWTNDDIPGGLAKMEATSTNPNAVTSVAIEVKSIEKK